MLFGLVLCLSRLGRLLSDRKIGLGSSVSLSRRGSKILIIVLIYKIGEKIDN